MARFIVDVANLTSDEIKNFIKQVNEIETTSGITQIVCVDESNENQFYDNPSDNYLSDKQIFQFKKELSEDLEISK